MRDLAFSVFVACIQGEMTAVPLTEVSWVTGASVSWKRNPTAVLLTKTGWVMGCEEAGWMAGASVSGGR